MVRSLGNAFFEPWSARSSGSPPLPLGLRLCYTAETKPGFDSESFSERIAQAPWARARVRAKSSLGILTRVFVRRDRPSSCKQRDYFLYILYKIYVIMKI